MLCCRFCGAVVPDVGAAIENDWYPDFWEGEIWHGDPVCSDCQDQHLELDESEEYMVKAGHALPPAWPDVRDR